MRHFHANLINPKIPDVKRLEDFIAPCFFSKALA
jgi:hypothetical protein